ncbi:hypothetical protein ACOSQ4_032151 [Xanthoceras sorbifolium]
MPPPTQTNLHLQLLPNCIYYGLQEDYIVQASTIDGRMTGYNGRRSRLSPDTLLTLHESQRMARERRGSSTSIYFDKDSHGFDWLLGGWLAEKRIASNDSYRWLYYDPLGRQYRSKQQVLRFYQEQNFYSTRN